MFGLSTSARSISAAAADHAASSGDLGTPLTRGERAQLLAAERAGQNVDAVSQAAQNALPASFAGAWYDYANGGTIYVAFAPPGCPDQALRTQLTQLAGVRVVPVAAATGTTATRLDALQTAVERETAMLGSHGVIINRTEIDTPKDRFLVTLDPSSVPGAQQLMNARYGSQGLAFAPPARPAKPADARNNPRRDNVHGGQDITDGSGRCTANISISSSTKGGYFVMTAGHCFTNQDRASQNGSNSSLSAYSRSKSIGHVAHTPVYNGATTSCDCEAVGPISASRASNATLVDGNRLFTFDFVAFSNKNFTGSPPACEDGVTEYNKYNQIICGRVDDAHVSQRIAEPPPAPVAYRVTDMIHVHYAGGLNPLGGDSGAPTGNGTTLLGLVTDGGGDSTKAKNMSDIYHSGRWIVPGH